jgi:hypothetical protein
MYLLLSENNLKLNEYRRKECYNWKVTIVCETGRPFGVRLVEHRNNLKQGLME